MPKYVGGLELSEAFYLEAVRPVLEADFPHVQHSAALIGPGSEVLGYDTEQSTDHHWGPRLMLFLTDDDFHVYSEQITAALAENLPYTFKGYSTNFGSADEI